MKNILFSILLSTSLMAGGEVGVGGDVIICFQHKDTRVVFEEEIKDGKDPFHNNDIVKQITSIETLDLYEYKLENLFDDIIPDVYQSSGGFRRILSELLRRVEKRTSFYDYLEEAISNLPENYWKKTNGIPEIDDEGYTVTLKQNCLKVQIARQKDNLILVNNSIFTNKNMSSLSRATLMLHEYVYNVALSLGYKDSSKVRRIVGYLISGSEWEEISTHELNKVFADFLEKKEFSLSGAYQISGQELWLESYKKDDVNKKHKSVIQFYSNGQIKAAISAKDQVFRLNGGEIDIAEGMDLLFSEDGKLLN